MKPIDIEFKQIIWPSIIANPPAVGLELRQCTEEPEATDDTNATNVIVPHGFADFFTTVFSIEDALRLSLPIEIHQNNKLLFTLARAVKTLERQEGKFSPTKLVAIFDQ